MPPYLHNTNFDYIKKNSKRIQFVKKDVSLYLKECKDKSINKINYSDIFDWCSKEKLERILDESYRILKPGGVIFYRELFTSREIPDNIKHKFNLLAKKGKFLHEKDNTPLYHRFVILKKNK